ncbi:hypothetical protein [Candidatus Nanohalococcus occultus]|uniref:hypothetical protein n=1 Tax=Candidatus Nanohalococcus occultus TaxID=2978047 RepID=UPI0039E11B65
MNDPWKYIAFPAAAVIGYLASLVLTQQVAEIAGLTEFASRITVIGGAGLVSGFMVDELIPAYIEKLHGSSGSGAGGGDMDFDSGDLDFD